MNIEVVQNCFWELAVLSQQDDPQFCSDFELGIGTLLSGVVDIEIQIQTFIRTSRLDHNDGSLPFHRWTNG